MRRRGLVLPIVVLDRANAYADEFKAMGNPVHCLPERRLIYEDRLLWSYQQTAQYRPRAVLSCLSSESFEILRVVPSGVLRMSIVQSDDPGPYATVANHGPWTDVAVGVSRQIVATLQSSPELRNVRAEMIPYGIDFAAPRSRTPRAAEKPLRVIYLGRIIEEQKRISRIAQLAKALEARGAHAELTIVGDGPQREQLRSDLRSCGIVRFQNAVPYDKVNDLLLDYDVFVLLSDFEGLPLSLLEAMGCGVVPVVSDLRSGISEVVDQSRGFRVPVGDVDRAADIVMELSRNRTKLHECSEQAARFVREHYSADQMAESYCRLVDELALPSQDWPATVRIPVPKGVSPAWLYAGPPRVARRWMKRLIGAF